MKTIYAKNGKILLSIGIIGIVILLMMVYFYIPCRVITLDVNPSLELQLNRMNQVVTITPINEDAIKLLSDYKITTTNLNTVLDDLVVNLHKSGYLASDTKTDILISEQDSKKSQELLKIVKESLAKSVSEKQLQVVIIEQSVDADKTLIQRAQKYHISAGKLLLIDNIVKGDDSLTPEDFIHTSITELIQYASKHNILLESFETIEDNEDEDANNIKDDMENDNKDDIEHDQDKADEDEDQDDSDEIEDTDHSHKNFSNKTIMQKPKNQTTNKESVISNKIETKEDDEQNNEEDSKAMHDKDYDENIDDDKGSNEYKDEHEDDENDDVNDEDDDEDDDGDEHHGENKYSHEDDTEDID